VANTYWKKMEKSNGFRRAKLFLKRVSGKEPWLKPDIAVTLRSFDCWSLCPDLLGPGQIVYSLGVGDTIEFDLELIQELGVEVHAFDPTPHALTWITEQKVPASFHFHPWAAAAEDGRLSLYPRIKSDGSRSSVMYTIMEEGEARSDGVEVPALTVPSMMRELGHEMIDLLKMDIEGAEYGVIENLLSSGIRPNQLLIEFHHRFRDIGSQQTVDAIESIRAAGYGLVDIAPTGREFSFVRLSALS
jgi:FkbM family methyltransferase